MYEAFIANFADIEFGVPDHMDLAGLLPEISGMDYKPVLNGMARAVNAETLLKLCRCRGEGRLAIGVTDKIIPENNHTFLLDFAPGRENLVERTEGPADIELDAGNLAVLLGGCRGADSIAMTPDIRVNFPQTNLAQADSREKPAQWGASGIDLSQVFYRKPCHILNLF